MKSFKSFLNEKNLFIYSSAKELNGSGTDLVGVVDSSDMDTIMNIKGAINLNAIEAKLDILLPKKLYNASLKTDMVRIFEKYFTEVDHLIMIDDIIAGKNIYKIKKSGEKNNDSINSIAQHYNSLYKIPVNFFKDLANLSSKDRSGTAIGKGEFVLGLLTDLQNAVAAGDLSDSSGDPIEVKGPRGRFKGQFGTKGYSELKNDVLLAVSETYDSTPSKEQMEEYQNLKKLLEKQKSFSNASFDLMSDVIIRLSNEKKLNALTNICKAFLSVKNSYKPKSSDVKVMVEAAKKKGNDSRAFLLATHLLTYKNIEKFNKLILFKEGYINFSFLSLDGKNSIASLYKILNTEKLLVAGWADSPREAAFGITIK